MGLITPYDRDAETRGVPRRGEPRGWLAPVAWIASADVGTREHDEQLCPCAIKHICDRAGEKALRESAPTLVTTSYCVPASTASRRRMESRHVTACNGM